MRCYYVGHYRNKKNEWDRIFVPISNIMDQSGNNTFWPTRQQNNRELILYCKYLWITPNSRATAHSVGWKWTRDRPWGYRRVVSLPLVPCACPTIHLFHVYHCAVSPYTATACTSLGAVARESPGTLLLYLGDDFRWRAMFKSPWIYAS